MCRNGRHKWDEPVFVQRIVKNPRQEIYGDTVLNYSGLDIEVYDRQCKNCGKEERI